VQPCGVEQFRCGDVPLGDLDDRVMDMDRVDMRMADEVRDRAEVVDVRMRHDDRVDASTPRDHPRQKCASSDAPVAA
jgi:hypothetical protein